MKKEYIHILSLLLLVMLFSACRKDDELIELFSDPGSSFLDIENDGYFVQLQAQGVSEGQNGTWRIFNGDNGRFEDQHNPTTLFYGEPGETYLLGWEVSQNNQVETGMINVSFKALNPVIKTQVTDTLYNNISLHLEADPAKFGAEGVWKIIDGQDGQIINPEEANAIFIGKAHENYHITWTLSYGSKSDSSVITFTTDELKANAGEDDLQIYTTKGTEIKYYNLNAHAPAGGSGVWKLVSGPQGKVYNINDASSIFEGIADTTYLLTWAVEVNGVQDMDTLKLAFRDKWGIWTDPRDGQTYRYATENGLDWMAENYNYNLEYSPSGYGLCWYYGQSSRANIVEGHAVETEEDRKYYGRLYNYYGAYEATPPGWRLPSPGEIADLIATAGGGKFAYDNLIEGGETGVDFVLGGMLGYSGGYVNSRDTYDYMGISGVIISDKYFETDFSFYAFEISSQSEGLYRFRTSAYFTGASVRYVRDAQ